MSTLRKLWRILTNTTTLADEHDRLQDAVADAVLRYEANTGRHVDKLTRAAVDLWLVHSLAYPPTRR